MKANNMRIKLLGITLSTILLSGCFAGPTDLSEPNKPKSWSAYESTDTQGTETENLRNWWQQFNDPALNELIELTLINSPDRNIAQARILEARGIRRTTRSALFPQLGASANTERSDLGFVGPDDFYDASFDASFELDIFGKNRKNASASTSQLRALEAQYHDTSLTLIAEVSRNYIDYRAFKKQIKIAEKNLDIQEKTANLIRSRHKVGEAPRLDVERADTLVNTTKSSIPEFRRLADNARLSLSVLTGYLPEEIKALLETQATIPNASLVPILTSPSNVLSVRPDIQAAQYNLSANTKLAESAWADLFPSFTLSGLFGESKGGFSPATTIWTVAAGTAVNLIDFGRIEGQIDAARAREKQAYETYRRAILYAVAEVETALIDYARIDEQRDSLQKAFENADRALKLSQQLYNEGEISFIDVLDAQRTVNTADSALINAEAAQSNSLVRLYKSLGVY